MRNTLLQSALLALLAVPPQAYSCTWADGYFHQVSSLRGSVVGAKLEPLQYARWLRQSFTRSNAKLSLYQYRSPKKELAEMPPVKTTKTDGKGRFDFGAVAPGHYTLVVDGGDWGTSDWFDVEVKQQHEPTVAVIIDVSPQFPDCKGGHEFIVTTKANHGR